MSIVPRVHVAGPAVLDRAVDDEGVVHVDEEGERARVRQRRDVRPLQLQGQLLVGLLNRGTLTGDP